MIRIGHGYDAHRFAPGAKLVLGGVAIEFDRGLAAHSDGDVLVHALCDALLGAAGLGDIGAHFPDTSAKFAGIDSRDDRGRRPRAHAGAGPDHVGCRFDQQCSFCVSPGKSTRAADATPGSAGILPA